MQLQGRTLQARMQGDDVRQLQNELRQLGYDIGDRDGVFGSSTRQAVLDFQRRQGLEASGGVDERVAQSLSDELARRPPSIAVDSLQASSQAATVRGRVVRADGRPVPGLTVRAFDKELRAEKAIGEATTGDNGAYAISYTRDQLSRPTKTNADLVVRAFEKGNVEVAVSATIFEAPAEQVVHLVYGNQAYRGPSEYTRVREAVTPHLGGIDLAEVTMQDVAYLAEKTRLEARQIACFARGAQLEKSTGIAGEAWYGLFRKGMPTSLSGALKQESTVQRRALQSAIDDNLVSAELQNSLEDTVQRLRGQIVEQAFVRPPAPHAASLGDVLSKTGLPQAQQREFLDRYLRHDGSIESFWDGLRKDSAFGAAKVGQLQATLQLSTLALNHLPLIDALQKQHKAKQFSSVRDLAKRKQSDWEALLRSGVGGTPTIPGKDDDARIANYARTITWMLEDAFPTTALAAGLKGTPHGDTLDRFLTNNPTFEFRETSVDAFLSKTPNALKGFQKPEEARAQLKAAQRLFNVTPRYGKANSAAPLLKNGLDSAYAIRQMGQAAFFKTYSPQLGATGARSVYNKAGQTAGLTLTLFAQHSPAFNGAGFYVTGSPVSKAMSQVPNYESLFGSLDLCGCEHCESVYSPAAYLVDVLHFLEGRITGSQSALDVLFERRPDIGAIELTCDNTNTLLPYVDLVCEILENAVSPSGQAYQTEGSADVLRVQPEHLNRAAYDTLASDRAVYPWGLPFDLWAEEARTYLDHLGVPRDELMQHFSREDGEPAARDIACETLRLTPLERRIITGAITGRLADFWGLPGGNLVAKLQSVSNFLKKSGLTYAELEELLAVPYINPNRTLRIEFTDASCNLDTATIANLKPDALDRIHRFVRLQRKLGWRIYELGAAVQTLPPHDLTDALLNRLANVKRLQAALDVPLIEMFSWWSNISTTGYADQPSLYETLFLDKTILSEDDPVFAIFALNAAGSELAGAGATLDDYAATIVAALGITEEELTQLIAAELAGDHTLNLNNLSRLYRAVSLAEALDLSISEFLSLRALSGADPFNPDALTATVRFADTVARISDAGFSLAELDYLLRHVEATPGIAPGDDVLALFLDDLRNGLSRIATEYSRTDDPLRDQVNRLLALLLSADDLATAMTLLDGDSTLSAAEQETFVREHFAVFIKDIDAAIAYLIPARPPTDAQIESRYSRLLDELLVYLRRSNSENLIEQQVADAFDLEMETSEQLLVELAPSLDPNTRGQAAIVDFLALTPIAGVDPQPDMTAANFPAAFGQYRRLHKIALVLNQFEIPAEDVAYYFDNAARMGWLDLNKLPLTAGATYRTALFDAWEATAVMIELRDALPPGEPTLFDLLEMLATGATEADFQTALVERTGWPLEDVVFLTGAGGFKLAFPGDWQDALGVRQLARLNDCFGSIARIGMSAQQVWSWNTPGVTVDQALGIKQAARSKYDEAQWLAVAQPLRDDLREKQRAALVAYVVYAMAAQGIQDADDLFGYCLIDPEMSACFQTSRIKQALSSVQLFVQRCLMNLEADVTLTAEDADEWAWMKNYRVWEANRKIFLYPENWIEPELRDDQSSFFTELENELLQNEVTLDTAEQAFLNYLEKLDAVSRLEISGLYRQRDEDTDTVHVIARTRNTPHLYYYRRWVDNAYWTAWERVDLDIEGDHLLPVVYNRRLYLFWAIIHDIDNDETPQDLCDIQWAWSEYKAGKWRAKQVADSVFTYSVYPGNLDFRILSISFKSRQVDGELIITGVYSYRPEPHVEFVEFKFIGCDHTLQMSEVDVSTELMLPQGSEVVAMKFVEKVGVHPFELSAGESAIDDWVPMLDKTPGTFKIAYGHQYTNFGAHAPFFYEDDMRTFFVVPTEEFADTVGADVPAGETEGSGGWSIGESITPGLMWETEEFYLDKIEEYELDQGIFDPIGPGPGDDGGGRSLARMASAARLPDATASRSIQAARVVGTPGDIGDILEPKDNYYDLFGVVNKRCLFEPFYHPYVCLLIKQLNRYGIDGVLNPDPDPGGEAEDLRRQLIQDKYFRGAYDPTTNVVEPYPLDEIDFSYAGAYAPYNWELFFQAPFLIANHLSQNQRFEEAQQWYHHIFDPTDRDVDPADPSDTAHFWKVQPLYEHTGDTSIQELMSLLSYTGSDPESQQLREELELQIAAWREQPFSPHVIARLRLSAYQKAIVMKYLDNLIAWGDNLFQRDTIESINEATQLYILAAQILGDRPETAPAPEDVVKTINGAEVKTFNDLRGHLDDFSNALVELETSVSGAFGGLRPIVGAPTPPPLGPTLFFCIPENDKLLGYWDTVADRLFKIRHCMNIAGVVRQLPLFEPPIEPGLLVRAAAAGVDIASALSDLYAPLPHYRFQVMLQKAIEFCADVRSLGGALLAALEKKDAEGLALLRAGQETRLLEAVRQVREQQVDEAQETLAALQASKSLAEARQQYYASREYTNASENVQLTLLGASIVLQGAAGISELAASFAHGVPDAYAGGAGTMGSPLAFSKVAGGSKVGAALQAFSRATSIGASVSSAGSSLAATTAGFVRRSEEWKFQAEQAALDIKQIEKQIAAAEIRLAIAERELANHDLQIENAKAVESFMQDKFTNQELYSWMVSQISGIYFQTYQMAYDLAKRAEKAYQHELGVTDSVFIQFGYWDSLKKGLLSGEKLHYDLKRMESSYLDRNKREYEITKHVSLALLDPAALVNLRETGTCFVNLPEVIFDVDYPGHYKRRIKSISLTIPCVTGPYTSVNCTLTLLSNQIRVKAEAGATESLFQFNVGGIQSIATSSAQNDSGLFELNFRDERYLPFEGAGVISNWRIELPTSFRQFDSDTISDVIIHVRYTAQDGGSVLRQSVEAALADAFNTMLLDAGRTGLYRLFSARQEFPNEWHRFLHPSSSATGHSLPLALTKERFPYQFRDKTIAIKSLTLFAKLKDDAEVGNTQLRLSVTPVGDGAEKPLAAAGDEFGGLPQASWEYASEPEIPDDWRVTVAAASTLDLDALEDLGILCHCLIED